MINNIFLIFRSVSFWINLIISVLLFGPIAFLSGIVSYILKKELLRIPLFGWCLFLLRNIAIDRSDGVNALKKILNSCNEHIANKRTLIIFPEGTRVPYGQRGTIKKGIFKIVESLKITSLVLNHDAGKYWSRDSFIIKPGCINIETLSLDYTPKADNLNTIIREHFY